MIYILLFLFFLSGCGDRLDDFFSMGPKSCGVIRLLSNSDFSLLADEPDCSSSAPDTLFVADQTNRRVLTFKISTLGDGKEADNVFGQSDFTSSGSGLNSTNFGLSGSGHLPKNLMGSNIFVSDIANNRILVFDFSDGGITNGEAAIRVLGQTNFTSGDAATTQSNLSTPDGIELDNRNNRLFVADQVNNRVMIFDIATVTNGENAVNVLCQATFTTSDAGTTQSTCSSTAGVAYDEGNNRLFVSDLLNNRILIFNSANSLTNGQAASNVLGQADFTSAGAATTAAGLSSPNGVAYHNNKLYVADTANHRVIVYDVAAITNGENAINVLGQSSFTTAVSATSQSGMNEPIDVAVDPKRSILYVADSVNNRVLTFDISTIINGENAINVLGQTGFTTADAATTRSGMSGAHSIGFR